MSRDQSQTTVLPSYAVKFGLPLTRTETLAGLIATNVFPHVNDAVRQGELRSLLMAFAAEIKRSAIEGE